MNEHDQYGDTDGVAVGVGVGAGVVGDENNHEVSLLLERIETNNNNNNNNNNEHQQQQGQPVVIPPHGENDVVNDINIDDDNEEEEEEENGRNNEGEEEEQEEHNNDENGDYYFEDEEVIDEAVKEEMFNTLCARVAENDPELIEFVSEYEYNLPLNDIRAIQLGTALVGNTSLEHLTVFLGPLMITNVSISAQTLAKGIQSCSNLKELVLNNRYLEDKLSAQAIMAPLYLDGVHRSQTIECLHLYYWVGDVTSLALVLRTTNLMELTIEGDSSLSLSDLQILGNGLRESLPTLKLLAIKSCNLRNEQFRVLSPSLGSHRSLETLEVFNNQQLGDDAVASFVEHWHHQDSLINVLCFDANNIGPTGAQLLVNAVSQHSRITSSTFNKLSLESNYNIGYEGLKLIGESILMLSSPSSSSSELPYLKLKQLNLNRVATWTYYDTDDDDDDAAAVTKRIGDAAAVQQRTKCIQAGRALLHGVRANFYLEELHIATMQLPSDVIDEIDLYTEANRNHRHVLLLQQTTLPLGIWAYFLSKPYWQSSTSSMFLILRELDVLMNVLTRICSSHGNMKPPPIKRQRQQNNDDDDVST